MCVIKTRPSQIPTFLYVSNYARIYSYMWVANFKKLEHKMIVELEDLMSNTNFYI